MISEFEAKLRNGYGAYSFIVRYASNARDATNALREYSAKFGHTFLAVMPSERKGYPYVLVDVALTGQSN